MIPDAHRPRPARRRPAGLGAVAMLLALAAALACPPARAGGRVLDLSVIDRDTGQVLPVHRHEGRLWIAGRPGARYAISLRNRLGERLLAVVSVDGVNVVSGETAGWSQAGYVLAGRQRAAITGWRKSDDQVAAFEFTSLGDAYATRTGRPSNVGVIGVAVFRERAEPPAISERESAPSGAAREQPAAETGPAASAPSASAPAPADDAVRARRDEKLGTGHGGREWSPVRRTGFTRVRETPDEVVALHYDSRDNLVALGVLPMPRPALPPAPDPFPRSASSSYVPDPPVR